MSAIQHPLWQPSRRDFLRMGAGLAAALGACSDVPPESAQPAAAKPNIVLIMSDDLGYEAIGCYGGTSYKTPNVDRLAATGVRFTHAYAQPLCTPTRMQLMTGQYNFRNWKAFGVMDPSEVTIGHTMQQAGYRTCVSGKWQLYSYNPPDFEPEWRGKGMPPEQAGFDDWFLWHARHTEEKGSRYAKPVILDNGKPVENTEDRYGPDLYTAHINQFMENHVRDHAEQPFFVYYPMVLTHGPFNPTPHSADWATDDRLKSDPKKYFGDMVEYMDEVIGRIVAKIDELGVRENTLILYFSDNGSPKETAAMMGQTEVKGGKGDPTDAGTRVPLIANWKGVTPGGAVVDDLIDSTDIYSTIVELGGANYPKRKTIDGVSFLPQLKGQPGHAKEVIICWHDPRPGAAKENYTKLSLWARTKRFKLYDDGRLFDIENDVLERSPIPPGNGSEDAEGARAKLAEALKDIPREPPA